MTKGDISREQILDLGARMFSDGDSRNTTMRDLARGGGISLGCVYFHFKSKDELISAIVERYISLTYENTRATLAALPADVGTRSRILAAIRSCFHNIASAAESSLALRYVQDYQAPVTPSGEYMGARQLHRKLWFDLFLEGQADGTLKADASPVLMFHFLIGAMNWTVRWYDPRNMSLDRVADHFSLYFLGGVQADAAMPVTPVDRRTSVSLIDTA